MYIGSKLIIRSRVRSILILASLLLTASALGQTQSVTFSYETKEVVKTVCLAGSFNDWSSARDPMKSDDGKHWSLTKSLKPDVYQYKFVVEGRDWVLDPNAKQNLDDGNGNTNSLLWLEPTDAPKDGISRVGLAHYADARDVSTLEDGQWRINLRARKGDLTSATILVRGGGSEKMEKLGEDPLFAYFSGVVRSAKPPAYGFQLGPHLVFGKHGLRTAEFAAGDDWFVPSPAVAKTTVPTWVRDAVFYQIFPERFANGDKSNDPPQAADWNGNPSMDSFFGGDLAGVRKHMDYIQDLGVNVIKFNPINQSRSNHKYDTDDYMKVDREFGTNDDFAALAKDAHDRHMRIILDGVYNHSGINFFAFKDVLKNQEKSPYLDWYRITGYPVKFERNPKYWTWGGTEYMPKFNHANPKLREYLFGSAEMWLKLGADGFRLDAANEVASDFWVDYRKRVKAARPDAYICGEIWGDALPWLQGDQFDATMNYPFRGATLDFVRGSLNPSQFDQRLLIQRLRYPVASQYAMYNLLGSHDTKRLVNEVGFDMRKVSLAKLIQFTYIGAPVIYYGDEIAMEGANELGSRLPMKWDLNVVEKQQLEYTKRLVHMRHESEALRRGDFHAVLSDDAARTYAYLRKSAHDSALVVLNASSEPRTVTVPVMGLKDGTILQDYISDEHLTVTDGKLTITLRPFSGHVYLYR